MKRDKNSCVVYNLMYNMHTRNFYFSKWLDCVQNTLNNCGFSEYWIYLFIYLYTLFNEGKTHLANIKLFYHVVLSNTCNVYT